jgi:CHAT domain/PAN domain
MTAVLSVDTLAAASHSWIGERMKNSANLEVNVHRRDNGSYSIVLRCTPPGGDVDISRVGEAQFDFERLRASELDTLPYATLLTNGLFKDPAVALAFGEARSTAQALEASLRIQLGIESNAPELHNLHWETLLDPRDGSYLFAGEQVLFSRYLSSQDWQPVNLRPQTPVTALVVIANPANLSEFQLMPVDVEGELKRAQTSMRGIGMTTLAAGGTATLNNLAGRLRDGGHDILYLVCHGSMVDGEPWLWIEDEAGKVARVGGANLVARLKELRQRPRLVVLASCQSAGNADRGNIGAGGALVSLGPRLVGAGIPAVLAMQGSVSMETVARFMPVFFHELLRDGQIDRAMAVARGAISDRPDFWMPVLFMRLKSGRIWDRPSRNDDRGEETNSVSAYVAGTDQRGNPPSPSPLAPERDHGRKRLIGAIAGTLILLATVVIGWLILHPRPQPPIVLTGVAPLQQKLALAQEPPIVSNAVPQNGPPIPKPYERDKKDNVRFLGREFPGSEFVPPEANWNRCYDACASNPQCRAFTYVKPNATYVMANGRLKTVGPNGSCHLKRDVTNQKPDKCCISIFVRNPTS